MLEGTAAPDSEIAILIDAARAEISPVDENGVWNFRTTFDEAGDYEIVLQAIDEAGEVVAESEPISLNVSEAETAAEIAAPTLELPIEAVIAGERVTLRGTGEPRSRLELLIDGETTGTATISSLGRWLIITQINDPGDHVLSAQLVTTGGTILAASEPVNLTIAEPVAEVVVPTLDLPVEATFTSSTITLRGSGEAGAEVEIFVEGESVGTTTVDAIGFWLIEVELGEPGD
jgi:hypothetical protein